LMASFSRASCDIASNTVTGRFAKIGFIGMSDLGRQARGLPAENEFSAKSLIFQG
jgi:hypothetical protein